MLSNKSTTIISEVKDFFTSSEKAIYTVLTLLSSLTLSEKHLGIESKSNSKHKNINKLLLGILMEKLIFNNQRIKKLTNYKALLQAGETILAKVKKVNIARDF